MNVYHTESGDIEYRISGNGKQTALFLHGGHMNASIRLGEDYFLESDYKVIAVSRPGYGRTTLSNRASPDAFSHSVKRLLDELGVAEAVVVGISAGGRTAIRFAANYPQYTNKLILQSATSFAKWPDLKTRIAAHIAFNSFSEKYTWRLVRFYLKKNPKATIKLMISNMTTLNPDVVVSGYTSEQVDQLVNVFNNSRSGKGFMNDIKFVNSDARDVTVPCLIIHSKYDKSVSPIHPQLLMEQISDSELLLSEAESHMIWFSPHYGGIKQKMDDFLSR